MVQLLLLGVGLLLALFAIMLVIRAAIAVARFAVRVARALPLAGAGGVAGAAIGAAHPDLDAAATALVGAGVLFLIGFERAGRRDPSAIAGPAIPPEPKAIAPKPRAAPPVPEPPAPAAPPPPEPSPEPQSAIARAWRDALDAAPDLRSRLVAARAGCELLLEAAERDGADDSVREWAGVIRARVPQLVGTALAHAEHVGPEERAATFALMAEKLERLAEEADERREAAAKAARDAFETMCRYVDERAPRDPLGPEPNPA